MKVTEGKWTPKDIQLDRVEMALILMVFLRHSPRDALQLVDALIQESEESS